MAGADAVNVVKRPGHGETARIVIGGLDMEFPWWAQALLIFGLLVAGVELVDQTNCYSQGGLQVSDFVESGRCE